MQEQLHIAQQRLITAARERREKSISTHSQTDTTSTGWYFYLLTFVFGLTLLAFHALPMSDLGHRLVYIMVVVLYYGWLWYWFNRQG